ncbi:MAG: hypothetical protein M3170_11005 [Candidatus Dormibacteraeota bacterium]|nr:hypothetical protein [Candidatus Dormibacteraeota bacterium]
MHLGSVLVGIVIGLMLGALIGWSLGRSRQRRRSADLPAPLPPAEVPAAPPLSPRAALLFAGGLAEEPAGVLTASASSGMFTPSRPHPEVDGDPALMEALRAASRRLNDEAQTRLSRESPDLPLEEATAVSAAPPGSGEHLLQLSRRLTEDSARLAREAESDRP